MRLLMYKLGDESVPIPQLTPEQMNEMGKVSEEATKAGVLVFNCGIAPTAAGGAGAKQSTIAQRIVRAKETIADANVPFEVPEDEDRAARLSSVLEVVYLIFNEGYSATMGDDWMRPELCADAMRLGRMLAQLTPDESEVHGLVALMEIQSSRANARVGPAGEPILLLDQDRASWDGRLIDRGLTPLRRAEQLGGGNGPYALQAAIAACHARAVRGEDTDWAHVAADRALRDYHLLPSVRGDLLVKLGRPAEARVEFERAAALTRNARERELSSERARAAGELAVELETKGTRP